MSLRQPQPARLAIVAVVIGLLTALVAAPVTAVTPSPSQTPDPAGAIEHPKLADSNPHPPARRTLRGGLTGIADA